MSADQPAERRTFDLTPEQAFDLVVAALSLVSSVNTPGVIRRLQRDQRAGRTGGPRPTVRPEYLLALFDVLEDIRPGMAENVLRDRS